MAEEFFGIRFQKEKILKSLLSSLDDNKNFSELTIKKSLELFQNYEWTGIGIKQINNYEFGIYIFRIKGEAGRPIENPKETIILIKDAGYFIQKEGKLSKKVSKEEFEADYSNHTIEFWYPNNKPNYVYFGREETIFLLSYFDYLLISGAIICFGHGSNKNHQYCTPTLKLEGFVDGPEGKQKNLLTGIVGQPCPPYWNK